MDKGQNRAIYNAVYKEVASNSKRNHMDKLLKHVFGGELKG